MPVEIAPYAVEHRSAIEALWLEFMKFHAARDPWFEPVEEGGRRFGEFLDSLRSSPDALILVALEGGEVIGYALAKIELRPPVYARERFGSISDVAIAETHRRRGIGSLLEDRMLAWFESKGVEHVELMAVAANEVSTSFWRKRGYRTQALIMSRDLEK